MKTNMLKLCQPNIKGELTLTIRDAKTLEVKRVQKEENISTVRNMDKMIQGHSIKNIGIAGGT